MRLTEEQFRDAVMHGYALYRGYNDWQDYLDEHHMSEPCHFGKQVLSLAWQKYQEQSSNSDYIRFAIALRAACEAYYTLSPGYWDWRKERICEEAYHHVTGVKP
jgi:hypothetical protein